MHVWALFVGVLVLFMFDVFVGMTSCISKYVYILGDVDMLAGCHHNMCVCVCVCAHRYVSCVCT